jgi:3'(2'), 5'-bisphosphate nucleotidase
MMSIEGEYPRPIHVNPSGNMAQIRRLESVESAHSDRHLQAALDRALGLRESPIQMDSQAKYGAVARGEADLYVRIPRWQIIRRPENIWDHAAGSIVVEEAGGKVTDLAGKPLDFASGAQMVDNQGILVSNGTIHGPTLRAIKQILG